MFRPNIDMLLYNDFWIGCKFELQYNYSNKISQYAKLGPFTKGSYRQFFCYISDIVTKNYYLCGVEGV